MTQRVKLSDYVLAELRNAIISGDIAQGSLHSIYELADRFKVSRTPVREAALRLADTGMVTIERNRGIRIRGLTVADIRRVFDMRLLLEVPGAARAARNATPHQVAELDDDLATMRQAIHKQDSERFFASDYELHDHILQSMDNPRLNDYVRGLRQSTQMMGAITTGRSRTLQDVGLEHEPIVDAIRGNDPAAAAEAMSDHLIETATLLMSQVAETTGEELPSGWPTTVVSLLHLPVLERAKAH